MKVIIKSNKEIHIRVKCECKYRQTLEISEIVCLKRSQVLFYICPRCNRVIDREFMRFCDSCGQKLSWNKINKVEVIEK